MENGWPPKVVHEMLYDLYFVPYDLLGFATLIPSAPSQ